MRKDVDVPPPPTHLDGAVVLHYAVSRDAAFHTIEDAGVPHQITAMAIARYDASGQISLFKCTHGWDVVQDWDCESVEQAMRIARQHARAGAPDWIAMPDQAAPSGGRAP
jgi:hypothetical protein